jgi:hypothetical protein
VTLTWDAPFFLRELREHTRRSGLLFLLVGIFLAVGVVLFGIVGHAVAGGRSPHPGDREGAMVALLGPHFFLCFFAGLYGADRVFGVEHRRSTLEGTLLLPLSGPAWLCGKLLFPFYLIALAWAVPLPFYLLAALLWFAPFTTLALASLIPLGIALLLLFWMLLIPPHMMRGMGAGTGWSWKTRKPDADTQIRLILGQTLLLPIYLRNASILARPLAWMPFYGTLAPRWAYLATIVGSVVLASIVTALATISGDLHQERRASTVRFLALALIYYASIGLYWDAYPVWGKIVALAAFPAATVWIRRMKGGRHEDPLAVAEAGWLSRRWDNPIAVKDFRVAARRISVRTMAAFWCLVLPVLWGFLFWALRWRPIEQRLDVAAIVTGIMGTEVLFIQIAIQQAVSWIREHASRGLPLLLVTPLRSRQMLLGRISGILVYVGLGQLPLVFGLAAAVGWGLFRGIWALGPVAVLVLCLLATICGIQRPFTFSHLGLQRRDWIPLLALVGQVLGNMAFFIVAMTQRFGPTEVWLITLALAAIYVSLVWVAFDLRVGLLEAVRQGDLQPKDM